MEHGGDKMATSSAVPVKYPADKPHTGRQGGDPAVVAVPQWYVVNTKPHQEGSAELNLRALGVETFFPCVKETKIIRRKRQTVIEPLFPGYFFVRFNVDDQYRAVVYARGIRKLVAFGGNPSIVDETVIDTIKSRLDNGYLTIRQTTLMPGQVVRIKEGPLGGVMAIFEREMSGQQRAVVLLSALAYQARVVVDLDQIADVCA